MSTASFKISYSGPSLDAGTMDVRELAPALLAFGSLLEESNRVLNGKDTSITVKVKRFEDGSFGISFDVIQNLTDQLIGVLTGTKVSAAANLIELLGFAGGTCFGLWKLLKKIHGRKPKHITTLEDGNIIIELGDDSVQVEEKVFGLYRDFNVRKAFFNALKPLEKEGITAVNILEKDVIIDTATKDDLPSFIVPEIEDEIMSEDKRIAVFSIHSLSFKEDNKWRLSDGTNTFFVTIRDDGFLRKVNENLISFAKGDILRVNLLVRTWSVPDGIKTDYEVLEVLEHKSAAKQLFIQFDKGLKD